jgi:hypothetical protein
MRVADLRGENPNSGNVSFPTFESNPLSSNTSIDTFSVVASNNTSRSNPLSSISTSTDSYIPNQYIRPDGVDTRFESTRETGQIAPNKTTAAIGRLWLDTARQSLADRQSSNSSILSSNTSAPSIDDLLSYTQAPPLPVEDPEPEADEEEEFYDAEEITQPPEQPIEPEAQPLVIEQPQQDLVVLNPPQTEAPLLYEEEDQTRPLKNEEPRQAEEQIPIEKLPDIIPFEDVIDQFGIKQLGQILIKNNITSEDGYPFFIKDGHVKTTLLNANTARLRYYQIDKPELKRYLIEANRNGLLNI